MKTEGHEWLVAVMGIMLVTFAMVPGAHAHKISFNSEMSYSDTQPTGGTASVANWTGGAFDADNIGGSRVMSPARAPKRPKHHNKNQLAGAKTERDRTP